MVQKGFETVGQPTVQMEQSAQPIEADVPLNRKDAAVACGAVLKLNEAGFKRIDLIKKMSDIVNDGGFTEEEIKNLGPASDWQDQAFKAYGFAYITWDKSKEESRADFDKMLVNIFNSENLQELSPEEKVRLTGLMVKLKAMMLRAFDLGRHDARLSPCPY
jgi:hypothetical protein